MEKQSALHHISDIHFVDEHIKIVVEGMGRR